MSATFIEAASIVLREGLEAVLVLAALAAYLSKMGADHRLTALWGGAGAALVASIGTAWVFEHFYNGTHSDMLEAAMIFVAAGLMFYVSGWLFLKQDPRAWQAFLRSRADAALAKSSALAVALLAFFAVAREGGETILFLHTLAKTSGGWGAAVIGGIAVAFVGIGILMAVVLKTTRRLPLRATFLVTSAFLFVMGLKFVGEGFQELQEQAIIPYDLLPHSDVLTRAGLNPTWEAVGTQLLIVALSVVAALWVQAGAAKNDATTAA